ncbi:MAG TPA: metallopeptidase family protein [Ktedonobacterales bacterium]|nr:metallopeptidase family protein [Ktedonobacterales bacterium]
MPELEPEDEQQDYYHILGVPEAASDDEIRHRYYTLAKKWHPDRFLNAAEKERLLAERRMKQLTRAYGVLGNAQLRLQYDERRTRLSPFAGDGHSWQPMPGMYSSSIVPPGFAAPAPSAIQREDKNGAGMFFALLSFLLAMGCLGLLLNRSPDLISGTLLILGLVIFGIVGLLFLQQDSPLSHLVNGWMEGEPGEFRQARAKAEQARALEEDERPNEALSAFEVLVEEALENIPAEFQEQMRSVTVLVEQEPDEETLERVGIKEGHILLGLYQGVPLTKQGVAGVMEHITIYQRTIETYCRGDPDRIRDQVTRTVLHELAHHFGIDHDEMPIWVK